jgi:type II secretory pathway component PulF
MDSLVSTLFSPRIGLRDLAQLCQRLAIALASGIEVRRVLERETGNTRRPVLRSYLREINDAVAKGDTFTEGLARTDKYFPPLLAEMVNVGEQTGHLAEVFRHLADHYAEQLRLRRSFLSSIVWPCVQLCLAIAIIGVMILVFGAIGSATGGQSVDILGLGLSGPTSFVIYWFLVGTVAVGGFFVFHAARRRLAWTEPLQKLVLLIPGPGSPLRTIALGQMAWTMDLTLDAGMDLLKAMQLAIDSTRNAYYTQHTEQILRAIRAGREVHEALSDTGAFPFEFLAAVEVGERSGRLPESMKNLAREYQERARAALQTLTVIASWGVWLLVAMIIVGMIFRIATQTFVPYVNTVRELSR